MADLGVLARKLLGLDEPVSVPDLSLRYAVVQSVQTSSATVRISGSATDISGVKYLVRPAASSTVAVAVIGRDLLILGSIGNPSTGIVLYDQTLAADAASIDTGAVLPPDFYVLEIYVSGQSTSAVTSKDTYIRFNADTGGNYFRQYVLGNNTSITGSRDTLTGIQMQDISGTTSGATDEWAKGRLQVIGYSVAEKHMCLGENASYNNAGAPNPGSFDTSSQWNNAAVINRVQWIPSSGNLKAGSRMRILGH